MVMEYSDFPSGVFMLLEGVEWEYNTTNFLVENSRLCFDVFF